MAGKGRKPCCDNSKVKRGPWSPEEDIKLVRWIQVNGYPINWRALPREAGLNRCGKSCRMRWVNYLSPDVKRGNFTREEEEAIIKLHKELGNKWSQIASHFPGRTDNEIKNVWNTQLKKRLNNNDQYYNPIYQMKENYIATSSSSFTSILCPSGRQEIRENIGMMNQENGVMNEIPLDYSPNLINPNLSNVGTNQMGNQDFPIDGPYQENNEVFINSYLTNVGTNQMGNQDFLIDGPYQENNEVFPNLYEDDITEFLDVPIDNEFWENWLKEDQVGTSLSQRKEEEIRQKDREEEEDKSMEWLKDWDNDLLGDL